MRWPTNSDVVAVRQREKCYSRFFLAIQKGKERTDAPTPLMVGQHYALVAADAYTTDGNYLTFNAVNFLLNSDIQPQMTLALGTLDDPFLYGSARIRLVDVGNNRLCLEPNDLDLEGYFVAGTYVWVDGVYRLYRILPRIEGGEVYEDGDPDSTGGVAGGIPGRGIRWNVNYLYRPVARMGSPRFAWTGEAINFYGWRSNGRGGNTVNAYAWDFDGGVVGGAGAAAAGTVANPVTARWDTAGEYIASLTVSDNSGKAGNDAYGVAFTDHVAVRPVLVYDRPEGDNPPYTDFEVDSLRGNYGSGWSATITVHGTADKSEFPDNALIIIFCEDWYGGVMGSRGGWYGQEGILFVGHIRADSVRVDSEKSSVTFEAQTIEQWMKEIDCWPINFLDAGGAPGAWHEFQNMTIEDTLWYLAELRSTLKHITDCFFASDVDAQKRVDYLDITEDSLYSQMSDQIGSCFFGEVSASRHGSIHLFKHKNMLDLIERTWWGPPIWSFEKQDWRDELQVGEERQRDSVAQVDFIGFYYNTDGDPQDCCSLAPERQTNFGTIEQVTGILLTGDTLGGAPDPQDEADALSGLYRAWRNIRFPHIRVPAKNNRFLEPATLDYFAIELDVADTVRGYDWDCKEFLCTEVSYEINNEKGIILADVVGEASTWGPEGVAGPYPSSPPSSDPPDEPPEYWDDWDSGAGSDPPPWFEAGGDTGLVYIVDGTNGRVFRVFVEAASPIYEDLGVVDAGGLKWIALDEFDKTNRAMVCGPNGVWSTNNLSAAVPTWTLEIANPGGWDGFSMVRSSPVQDGVWMAVAFDMDNEVGVWWTVNDGAAWNSDQNLATDAGVVSGEGDPYLELSSHDANVAWVNWREADAPQGAGGLYCTETTDMWASNAATQLPAACTRVMAYQANYFSPSHHRKTSNPLDLIAIWGCRNSIPSPNEINIFYDANGNPAAGTCTTICTNATSVRCVAAREVGCYRGASDKWWALIWCDDSPGSYRFYTSPDGTTWNLIHTFSITWPGEVWHMADWSNDENKFVATHDGTHHPLFYTKDGGNTWDSVTGNWNALGYTGDIRCVAVG